jgi:hypothetical protein
MEQPSVVQMKIPATESKREYLQQMKEMRERWGRQLEERELNICIKEMHTHMRSTKLKEEEELQEREEALRRGKKNLRYVNGSSRNEKRSLARLSIARGNSVMDGVFYLLL